MIHVYYFVPGYLRRFVPHVYVAIGLLRTLRSTLYLHPNLSLYLQSLAFVMGSAQLAIFKVPAIDNEPMVDRLRSLGRFQTVTNRLLSETMVRGL